MIYLLDLNYTLVDKEKDAPRIRPMELQIELETYRQWLIDMLKGKYVILTTARMQKYEIFTLNRIYTKTNWLPNESFFSIFRHLPHIKKEWILKWRIFTILRNRKQSPNQSYVRQVWDKIGSRDRRFRQQNKYLMRRNFRK